MKKPWHVALMIAALWGGIGYLLPIVLDEAYYLTWSKNLSLGYFDHPPAVAWLLALTKNLPQDIYLIRLGTLGAGLLTLLGVTHFFLGVGIRSKAAITAGLMLTFMNLMGLSLGVITTPDTILMVAWAFALGESAYALGGRPKRWLSAGFLTGIGLWGKYMMVLIGPVFLWALITEAKSTRKTPQLKTPWPYLGGLICLLTIAPHLWWNHNHDWVTMKFQFAHGLQNDHMRLKDRVSPLGLPYASLALPESPEWNIAKPFIESEQKETKVKLWYDPILEGINRYIGYYLSQVFLWGGLLLGMVRRGRIKKDFSLEHSGLIWGAALVPLIVFGFISLFSHVEANWSSMYLIGVAALLAPSLSSALPLLTKGALFNALIVLLLALHAHTPFLPLRPKQDRILKETYGFKRLAVYLKNLPTPVWADTYQLAAMTRFYEPTLKIGQWPGITRDSEFTRRPDQASLGVEYTYGEPGFYLVLSSLPPPKLASYQLSNLTHLRDCLNDELQVISTVTIRSAPPRCQSPIHRWYLAHYKSEVGLRR